MYGRLMIIIMTMFLYLAKAGVQWVNKMTMFNERLIKTLFFRVIDNNRGKKTPFLRHLFIKCSNLPRQARDEHRESTQKRDDAFSYRCSGRHATRSRDAGAARGAALLLLSALPLAWTRRQPV
jgi:hypothetical protein